MEIRLLRHPYKTRAFMVKQIIGNFLEANGTYVEVSVYLNIFNPTISNQVK